MTFVCILSERVPQHRVLFLFLTSYFQLTVRINPSVLQFMFLNIMVDSIFPLGTELLTAFFSADER